MALDRQRILNELGSVMYQLQSADCGCMGKLFGDSSQSTGSPHVGSPLPTCGGCRRNSCCGHGNKWNSNASCGDPYHGTTPNTYTPCMGRCNPPKLYADTYNYLTHNLMQPTVNEVFNDLKSLTPDNSIANNPMANQMGLTANGITANSNKTGMPNESYSSTGNINTGNPYSNFISQTSNGGSMPTHHTNQNQMGERGGMGPQIMSMVGGNLQQNQKSLNIGQNSQLTEPMLIDAPQSPHGQIGVTPLTMRTNQGVYNTNPQGYSNEYNRNQTMIQQNLENVGNTQGSGIENPAAQQMKASHRHGHHTQGVAKFNEMFPGVMNNMGGDLGFDPMAIAIQMNPANQQQAAISTMNKMLHNNDINKVFEQSANPGLLAPNEPQQNQTQNNIPSNEVQKLSPLQKSGNETIQQQSMSINKMAYQNTANVTYPNEHLNTQQVYAAKPIPNQPINLIEQQNEQQNMIDTNTGSAVVPPTLSSAYAVTTGQPAFNPESPNLQKLIKEPILPADNSRYTPPRHPKHFEFNTLGQPIEKFSAEIYRTPEPTLPQTLSPQYATKPRIDAAKYSNVKSTVSKTSLMGAKLGRTPSQLQHIYNQYKGSQSLTQQNLTATGVNNGSHSEGKLNASQSRHHQKQTPVEKVGGDTMLNNRVQDEHTAAKVEQVIGQIGDVPVTAVKPMANKTGDAKQDQITPIRKTRNGLQDMVYTSYPASSWTFHGVRPRPYSPGYRRYGR